MGTVPEKADVVVIGGGMGGLTAATLLAQAGLSVCVLEPELRPGGYLAGFQRRKFHFDSAIHWLNQCGPGGFVHKVFGHIGEDHPTCGPLRRIRRMKSGDMDYLLTDHPDALRESLCADFPGSAKGLHKLFDYSKTLGERMALYAQCMRSADTMGPIETAGKGLRLAWWGLPFARVYKKSTEEGFRWFGIEPDLLELWCSEVDLLSVMVPLGWAHIGDFQVPPDGGSKVFPAWLVGHLEAAGGQLALRRRAEEILLQDGRAVGVRTDKDEVIACDYVLAACDLETVYEKMLPEGTVPTALLEKLRGADLYPSSVSVHLGLDCPAEDLGFSEEMIYLADAGHTREAYGDGDPHTAGISVLAPTVRDKSLAPLDKGTLTLYCPAFLQQDWKLEEGRRGPAYKEAKAAYAKVLIDRVEAAMAPGLAAHIELQDVATPITHHRYTRNKGGSIMAARPNKANMQAKVAHYKTAVPNLFLSGHWAEYGGGVPIAVKAGSNAALLVLKKERPAAFAALAQVMDEPDRRGDYRPAAQD
jgi:phytoene dehydrogenase-like protein